jgi:hypothetical protein
MLFIPLRESVMLAFESASFPTAMFGDGAGDKSRPRGQALDSLVSSDLGERFYAWRGVSGATYVCSIFAAGEAAVIAGFSQGVVIGVHRSGALLQPLCLICARDFKCKPEDGFLVEARELGVTEWHVHFAGEESELRDLARALLD